MPDLAGTKLLMKYNMQTIKSHMDEQNLQVTEFFSNFSIMKTVTQELLLLNKILMQSHAAQEKLH